MNNHLPEPSQRLQMNLEGRVQGLGFRPFVYQLAHKLSLTGSVSNRLEGVVIEVQGPEKDLKTFKERLFTEAPALAKIKKAELNQLAICATERHFVIKTSPVSTGTQKISLKRAELLPDLSLCKACAKEIQDPHNRRFRYPFTNCTFCGPRYSIIKALPYDRERTAMASFKLCGACLTEYSNPNDRRFHAQPIACPDCGPQLQLLNPEGVVLAEKDQALQAAVAALKSGKILALKGLGGFQLLVDASNSEAIQRLRQRKQRPQKALAVLFADRDSVRLSCALPPLAQKTLEAYQAPIVLLPRLKSCPLSLALAPDNDQLGALLPYTPLHFLIMQACQTPLVCTSGNRSSEPLCLETPEALERLGGIADVFLSHNRPILKMVDDSVLQLIETPEGTKIQLLRRARGFAPEPIVQAPRKPEEPDIQDGLLALGGHLKNTFALSQQGEIFISQHLGDLNHPDCRRHQQENLDSLQKIFNFQPSVLLRDMHPDYASSILAEKMAEKIGQADKRPCYPIQHHQAHILAVMAEFGLYPPILGAAWDGLGWGPDQTDWGGEFLYLEGAGFKRLGQLRSFPLAGGEKSLRSPARQALGLLSELYSDAEWLALNLAPAETLNRRDKKLLLQSLKQPALHRRTSSAGRLFDILAALLNLKQEISFEAEAAIALETCARSVTPQMPRPKYRLTLLEAPDSRLHHSSYILDWEPLIRAVITDLNQEMPKAAIAWAFHDAMAAGLTQMALHLKAPSLVLSGGCFQNRTLLELSLKYLHAAGISYWFPQAVPANDGGLALGQIWAGQLKSRQIFLEKQV